MGNVGCETASAVHFWLRRSPRSTCSPGTSRGPKRCGCPEHWVPVSVGRACAGEAAGSSPRACCCRLRRPSSRLTGVRTRTSRRMPCSGRWPAGPGLDAQDLLAAIQTPEVKAQLKANTDEVIARGGFGSPTMFVGADDMYSATTACRWTAPPSDLNRSGRRAVAAASWAAPPCQSRPPRRCACSSTGPHPGASRSRGR